MHIVLYRNISISQAEPTEPETATLPTESEATVTTEDEPTEPETTTPPTEAEAELWSRGGCPDTYDSLATYFGGDVAEANGLVYQCVEWPLSLYCSMTDFVPGSAASSSMGVWVALGGCEGILAEGELPKYDGLEDVGGCPEDFAEDADYGPGDRVAVDGLVYRCMDDMPVPSAHCTSLTYEPGSECSV